MLIDVLREELEGGRVDRLPLIPNDVTPWFTALRAYSSKVLVCLSS